MVRKKKRWPAAVGVAALFLAMVTGFLWWGLSYQPAFYRTQRKQSIAQQHARAEQFVSQSMQLRNDIANEAHWEAVFTDEEVNAWLAVDLVESFADKLPAGISEPRLLFEPERVTLAFRYQDGPLASVIWAIVRIGVPRDNEISLRIEKIQAGAFPMPMDQVLERITTHALARGMEVEWSDDAGQRVATLRYTTDPGRKDVVLESVQIAKGWIRLSGRSDKGKGVAVEPRLPPRHTIQSRFSNRNHQAPDAGSGDTSLQSATAPPSS